MRMTSRGMLMAGLLSLLGCSSGNEYQAPPPPVVQVMTPRQQTVSSFLEQTGTTEAVAIVQVRARVRGFIDKVNFEPFTDVEKNQLLYEIEPRKYQADVELAKAAVAAAEVNAQKTQTEFDRQSKMFEQNATPERNVVTAKAEYDAAVAALQATKAELDGAELNLEYTQVRAPISGRIGKTLIREGNLVDGNEATHLADIVDYDAIYANFFISERELLTIASDPDRDGLRSSPTLDDKKQLKMYLGREIDTDFPFEGHFDSADLAVDQSTGTYRIRGIFDNPNKELVPGLFVRIRVPTGVVEGALLVPESCLSSDQAGQFLLAVNDKNEVERRDVIVGLKQMIGPQSFVVIQEGLKPTDRIVVNGLQRARPGVQVNPELLQPDTTSLSSVSTTDASAATD